jgi:hypothetical protein
MPLPGEQLLQSYGDIRPSFVPKRDTKVISQLNYLISNIYTNEEA